MRNPATDEVLAHVPLSGAAEVEAAAAAVGAAFAEWRRVPPTARGQPLLRLKDLLEARLEELAASIPQENGKTLAEARCSAPSSRRSSCSNRGRYGNMACLFTRIGEAARVFRHRVEAGNIGINLGVTAPMAFFPFSGWRPLLRHTSRPGPSRRGVLLPDQGGHPALAEALVARLLAAVRRSIRG